MEPYEATLWGTLGGTFIGGLIGFAGNLTLSLRDTRRDKEKFHREFSEKRIERIRLTYEKWLAWATELYTENPEKLVEIDNKITAEILLVVSENTREIMREFTNSIYQSEEQKIITQNYIQVRIALKNDLDKLDKEIISN